jgi:hypothetical protein
VNTSYLLSSYMYIYIYFVFFFIYDISSLYYFNIIKIVNYYTIFYVIISCIYIYIYWEINLKIYHWVKHPLGLFILINFFLYIFILINCSSLLCFIFTIEVIGTFLFLSFIFYEVERLVVFTNKTSNSINFIAVLFYYFFVAFFSIIFSVCLLFLLHSAFNLSEFQLINFLYKHLGYFYIDIIFNLKVYFFLFFFGFFFKLGVSPSQFYKTELYKSFSYRNIFMYTIFFFFCFLTVLIFIYYYLLVDTIIDFNSIYMFLNIFFLIYLIVTIIDVDSIRCFIALSSVGNGFFLLILALVVSLMW